MGTQCSLAATLDYLVYTFQALRSLVPGLLDVQRVIVA
jgi:hypothetical protein